jgi:hypothetical protein
MSKKTKVEPVGSGQVVAALQKGPFRAPAHIWLSEVRNQTGFARGNQRTADGLVVSLWPSRGIWFAGVEVKVDRRDWLRELDDPTKSEAIQQYCDYWWVAAPPGVVEVAELPVTWGLIEVSGGKCKTIKEAMKLHAKALKPEFVASVLRNVHDHIARVDERAMMKLKDEKNTEPNETETLRTELSQVRQESNRLNHLSRMKENEVSTLRNKIEAFERAAGLPEHTVVGMRSDMSGEVYALAQTLKRYPPDSIAVALRQAADALEKIPTTKDTG